MSVSRLLEELVPFMDHSIDDPAAMRMSGGHHKRKQPSSKVCCQYSDRLVLSMHSFLPSARPCHISPTALGCLLGGYSLSVACSSQCIGRPQEYITFFLAAAATSQHISQAECCLLVACRHLR